MKTNKEMFELVDKSVTFKVNESTDLMEPINHMKNILLNTVYNTRLIPDDSDCERVGELEITITYKHFI